MMVTASSLGVHRRFGLRRIGSAPRQNTQSEQVRDLETVREFQIAGGLRLNHILEEYSPEFFHKE